jgi:TonB-like protein
MKQSAAQYEWIAEDGSLTLRILAGVIGMLAEESRGRAGAPAVPVCGVLLGTTDEGFRGGSPIVAVESIAALPNEARLSVTSAIQSLFDKWPRALGRRVYAVGAYRSVRSSEAEPSSPELLLTRGTCFPAIELIVEGQDAAGMEANICFQIGAGRPVRCERLVFGHLQQLVPAMDPLAARADAGPRAFGLEQRIDPGNVARPVSWRPRIGIGLVVVALLSIAAAMAVKPHQFKSAGEQPELQSDAVYTDLGLNVERSGGSLVAAWNREAPGVVSATSGVLVIQDLAGRHNLLLDSEQLRAGSATYPAASDEMTIRLEVRDGLRNTGVEAVRLLSPPSQRGVPPHEAQMTVRIPTRAPVRPPAVRTGRKPFRPPPPATARTNLPAPIPDAAPDAQFPPRLPSVEPAGIAAPFATPVPPQPEPPAASIVLPANPSAPPARAIEGAATTAPVPVSVVSPSLPKNVKALIRNRIQVTVTVKVDATGKVTDATATVAGANPPGTLGDFIRTAAVNAARSWRFEPAKVNQRNVAGTCEIKFEFRPD